MTASEVYAGSDGALTRRFYDQLLSYGPIGDVAVNLFRAQKASERAKKYRGGIRGLGSYRDMAYERKEWALSNLCEALEKHAGALNIDWGWKLDGLTVHAGEAMWVLYVDLPFEETCASRMSPGALESGAPVEIQSMQVSFHAPARGRGPDYAGDWDRQHVSAARIIRFCDDVLAIKRQLTL